MAPRQRFSDPPSLFDISMTNNNHRPMLTSVSEETAPLASPPSTGNAEMPPPSSVATIAAPTKGARSTLATLDAEAAREEHDYFNLAALLVVLATTLINWDLFLLAQGYGPGVAWTGKHFYLNWATTVLYFLTDLVWVCRIPFCVKSPDVIIKHHIVAIAYLSGPIFWPEYRWFMGACLSVEINTWFLILRRVVYKRKADVPSILIETVSLAFYISWIVIRCFIYPAILVVFLSLARERVVETSKFWHSPMIFIPIHFFLCVLNLKWTFDLFQPLVKKWVSPETEGSSIANGL